MPAFRDLELLVAKIQQQLAPNAKIQHNVKLPGKISKTQRQIDVLLSDRLGQFSINIVIECKDYNRPADVKVLDAFASLLEDVGAQRGVLVCPSGFTDAAKFSAESRQIDLYSPVDSDVHKWTARVTMPALVDFRTPSISFGLSFIHSGPFRLPQDFSRDCIFFDENGTPLGSVFDAGVKRWEKGGFPTDPGVHTDLQVFDSAQTFTDNGFGERVPFKVYATIVIIQNLYFGQYPIKKISGFRDEIRGGLITNAFEFGLIDPDEVKSSWLCINNISEAPIPPVFSLTGFVDFVG